eukprot:g14249.t1
MGHGTGDRGQGTGDRGQGTGGGRVEQTGQMQRRERLERLEQMERLEQTDRLERLAGWRESWMDRLCSCSADLLSLRSVRRLSPRRLPDRAWYGNGSGVTGDVCHTGTAHDARHYGNGTIAITGDCYGNGNGNGKE